MLKLCSSGALKQCSDKQTGAFVIAAFLLRQFAYQNICLLETNRYLRANRVRICSAKLTDAIGMQPKMNIKT